MKKPEKPKLTVVDGGKRLATAASLTRDKFGNPKTAAEPPKTRKSRKLIDIIAPPAKVKDTCPICHITPGPTDIACLECFNKYGKDGSPELPPTRDVQDRVNQLSALQSTKRIVAIGAQGLEQSQVPPPGEADLPPLDFTNLEKVLSEEVTTNTAETFRDLCQFITNNARILPTMSWNFDDDTGKKQTSALKAVVAELKEKFRGQFLVVGSTLYLYPEHLGHEHIGK